MNNSGSSVEQLNELQNQLAYKMQGLLSQPELEFGITSSPVNDISELLQSLQRSTEELTNQFSIEEYGYKFVSPIYALLKSTADAISFVEQVRESNFGSEKQTKDLIKHLKKIGNDISKTSANIYK